MVKKKNNKSKKTSHKTIGLLSWAMGIKAGFDLGFIQALDQLQMGSPPMTALNTIYNQAGNQKAVQEVLGDSIKLKVVRNVFGPTKYFTYGKHTVQSI